MSADVQIETLVWQRVYSEGAGSCRSLWLVMSAPAVASEDAVYVAQGLDTGKWHIRLDTNFPMGHSSAKKAPVAAPSVVKAGDVQVDPLKRAQAAVKGNDDPAAIDILTAAIKANPRDKSLYEERAKCYLRVRQNYQAVQDLTKLIELGASTAVVYRQRANAYFLMHDFQHCLQDLELAGKSSKITADDYVLRANCNSSLGNPQLAIDDCTAALKARTEEFRGPTTCEPRRRLHSQAAETSGRRLRESTFAGEVISQQVPAERLHRNSQSISGCRLRRLFNDNRIARLGCYFRRFFLEACGDQLFGVIVRPVLEMLQCGKERAAKFGQRVFNARRHLGKYRAQDQTICLQFAQLVSKHALSHPFELAPEFIEAQFVLAQFANDQYLPFIRHHGDCRHNWTV